VNPHSTVAPTNQVTILKVRGCSCEFNDSLDDWGPYFLMIICQVFFFSHTVLSGKLPVDVVNYQFALCLYRTHKELLFSVQGKLVTLN